MSKFDENEQKKYLDGLIEKFKQDPLYEVRQEFGTFLFRHIDSLSPDELKRYNELKEQLIKSQS